MNISVRRKSYKLKPANKQFSEPQEYIIFDTESVKEYTEDYELSDSEIITFKHKFRIAYIIHVKNKKIVNEQFFYSQEDLTKYFLNLLNRKKRAIYVFAHNMHFDFSIGIKKELLKDLEVKTFIVDAGKFILSFYNKENKSSLIFVGTENFFKISVEKMGKILGIQKVKVNNFNTASDKLIKERCKTDVEILYLMLKKYFTFLSDIDSGEFKLTIPSQAFITFRKNFYYPIFFHNNLNVEVLEREAYYGGRTEVFLKDRKVYAYCFDVNSMYPYVMKNFPYPVRLIHYEKSDKLFWEWFNSDVAIIAKVRVKHDINCIPSKNHENRLIFRIGEYDTYLCKPELELLLKTGGEIVKVYEYAVYEQDYIFSDYVDFFYKLKNFYKKEKNDAFYFITKLFLNSLYGKFGQKQKKLLRVKDYDFIGEEEGINYGNYKIIENGEVKKLRIVNGKAFIESDSFEQGFYCFTAIAAYVTSYARSHLFKLIEYVKNKSGEVYYCDTDSLFVNKKELLKDLESNELGKLSFEKEGYFIFHGAKDYEFESKKIIKGIRKDSEQYDSNIFITIKFPKFKTIMQKRLNDIDCVYEIILKKELKREYKKGIVKEDGKVIPFT